MIPLPAPQPLPESLWGETWRFVSLPAANLKDMFGDRPIPYAELPESRWPTNLGLASSLPIPGVLIYGGRHARYFCDWLAPLAPIHLTYTETDAGQSGGMMLQTQTGERWIIATFTDAAIAEAGLTFEQRKQKAQGLHFLLVQPDDSGLTTTGVWLLQQK